MTIPCGSEHVKEEPPGLKRLPSDQNQPGGIGADFPANEQEVFTVERGNALLIDQRA